MVVRDWEGFGFIVVDQRNEDETKTRVATYSW
jgi:hypothetical protein